MSPGVHDGIVDGIGARIAAGDLPIGSVLTLAGLEEELGASRTAVREAVRVLESLGMVASRRRVGITVQPRVQWDTFSPSLLRWNLEGPMRQQQLESLMELRVAVEPMAARLAAMHASDAQRAELRHHAETLRSLGDQHLGRTAEFLEADIAFHAVLLHASGNPQLTALSGAVAEELRGRTSLGLAPDVPAPGTLEEHVRVAAAILAADAEAAEDHSRSHMRAVWAEVRGRG